MPNILIQHNFSSGFGDFFRSMTEYMSYCKSFKENGYAIHLYLNLSKNLYTNDTLLKLILDKETLCFFDSIIESYIPIYGDDYNSLRYCFSSYDPQTPAMHMWDLFSDNLNETVSKINKNITCENLKELDISKIIYPVLHSNIRNKSQVFKVLNEPYSFLHIRIEDFGSSSYKNDINIIYSTIDRANNFLLNHDTKFHIATNNSIVHKYFSERKNVMLYPFTNMSILDNEIGRSRYSGIDSLVIEERIVDLLAEMSSIQYADSINIITEFSWISSFLFYGALISNKQINLVR